MLPKYPIKAQNATNTESTDVAVFIVPDGAISGNEVDISAGGGVVGPETSTDNAIARFDGTDGATIQNSGVIITDTNAITGVEGGGYPNTPGIQFEGGTILNTRAIDGELNISDSSGSNAVSVSTANQTFVVGAAFQIGIASTGHPAASTPDIGLSRPASGILKLTNGSTGGGQLQMQETTTPSAPAANNGILYLEDDGGGKTRLMIRFSTGAAQQIAIEP